MLPYQLGVEGNPSLDVYRIHLDGDPKEISGGGSTLKALGIPPPNAMFHWGLRVGNFVHELDFDGASRLMFYDENKEYDTLRSGRVMA